MEFLSLDDVTALTGLSSSMIYKQIGQGHFPRSRTYPNSRQVFWLKAEIFSWMIGVIENENNKGV